MSFSNKTKSIAWQEGSGTVNGSALADHDQNGNRLVVVPIDAVAHPSLADGYPVYVGDSDDEAAKAVIDVQAALGAPA